MIAEPNDARRVGVVGTGAMGRGIIQLFALAGCSVVYVDAHWPAVEAATGFIEDMLRRLCAKQTLSEAAAAAARARLHPSARLADLADCEVVIEAIVEDLGVKRALFAELEALVPAQTILASNTSSLLIAEIAAACRLPQRVAGLHFFNPVPLMKLVEIIPAALTDVSVTRRLQALIAATGHRAVIAADQPGFIVNHAGRGLYTEGLRILEEGVADAFDIDSILREGLGFRMGPFELLDLTGLDVSGGVMESIYAQFQHEPRFRPSPLIRPRIAAGLFGRKSKRGFYEYGDGSRVESKRPPPPPLRPEFSVWLEGSGAGSADLRSVLADAAVAIAAAPTGERTIAILQFWGEDLSRACARRSLDPANCVAVDPLVPLSRRRTLMLNPATRPEVRDAALAMLGNDGVPVTVINDSVGFVAQRVIATVVNIACDIVQRRIASVFDLEDAVRLALGYPKGPLAWGDEIGAGVIRLILDHMLELTGESRYRASPWLRRRAELARPLTQPEALRGGIA